jgi:DNA modification methylase
MSSDPKTIVLRRVADLKNAKRNARTHSAKQLRKIADSITRFGFVTPVLVDRELRIVAGHGRWSAAKLAGLTEIPTLLIGHLSEAELRAYAIADNQIALSAGWDKELLSLELDELKLAIPELDLTVTGFELEQIELLADLSVSKRTPKNETFLPAPPDVSVCQVGDLWSVGPHKLLCGNSLERDSYATLLGTERADTVIADFPYNVPIAGHVSSSGKHAEFAMASGEMSSEGFERFLFEVCRQLARFSRSGSLHYLFMDWRSVATLIRAGEAHFEALLNIIVWNKHVGGMGSLYRSQHELIALFKNGKRPHKNNVELGANGRNRSNVWDYPGVGGFGSERKLADLHPTVKNLEMIADAIRDVTDRGDVVLDPFGGSGTTLIAAHRCDRRARLIELDPGYCDVTLHRAIAEGLVPRLEQTSEGMEEVRGRRLPHGDLETGETA